MIHCYLEIVIHVNHAPFVTDWFQIPNCLGALSGVAQLSLYAYFRPATPTVRDRNEEKGNSMKWVSSSVSILVEQNDHPPLNQPCGSIEALQICEKASN